MWARKGKAAKKCYPASCHYRYLCLNPTGRLRIRVRPLGQRYLLWDMRIPRVFIRQLSIATTSPWVHYLPYASSLVFSGTVGRTDVEAETPVLWPPDAKSWLIWKDPDAGKDWGQEEKGTTENEMVGWHHWLSGHGFGWTPGVGDGQGGLACCGSWDRKESDMTEWLNWTELNWTTTAWESHLRAWSEPQ